MPLTALLKLAAIELEPLELRLRAPLGRAGAPIEIRRGVRVRIYDASGRCGWGEALPLPSAGTESPCEAEAALLHARAALLDRSGTLAKLLEVVDAELAERPAARCGLDVALHDLAARVADTPIAVGIADDPGAMRRRVGVNALIGAEETRATIAACEGALERGYRTLKLKLGGVEPESEIERIAAIRSAIGPEPRLRLDVNGAWEPGFALRALERMTHYDIELIEQPVQPRDLDALARLHLRSPIPIAADESLACPEGRARLLSGELASVAVIKPMVQGGLSAATNLCRKARRRDIACLITTTLDGPDTTAAALHLAAAWGSERLDHGLAACDHFETAFPSALVPRGGTLTISDAPGSGLAHADERGLSE